MAKNIVIAVLCIVAALIIVIRLQPADFRVSRSADIDAPPEVVFPLVNDFRRWAVWSPWEKMDPSMQKTFSDPAQGTGATYAWSGNKQVGEGKMTLLESRPHERVRLKLEFLKPFAAVNDAEFTFASGSGHTKVTWSMSGQKNFMMKAIGLFMNMDKMVGGDFEKGLAAMKAAAETPTRRPANAAS